MSLKQFISMIVGGILIILLLFGVIDAFSPNFGFARRVPVGNVAVVTRFGEVLPEVKGSGFQWAQNWFDKYHNLDTRTQKIDSALAAFSKDMQEVDIKMTVNFNVTAETAVKLYKEVGEQYSKKIIEPIVTESTKVVFAKYTAEDLIINRGKLADEIKTEIVAELAEYNINISLVTINDIDFSDAFTDAVEAKQVATQEKLRTQTEQEQQTIVASAEAERKVIAAQAEADAIKAKADAEAYAIKTKAEAEAEANKKVAESITESLIDYNKINQWDGVLPTTVVGNDSATTLIPIN